MLPSSAFEIRIAGVERSRAVRAEVVGAGDVVGRVHADVARHALEVNARLDVVRALHPGDLVGDRLHHIGADERPARIVAEVGALLTPWPEDCAEKPDGRPKLTCGRRFSDLLPGKMRGSGIAVRWRP